MRTKEEKAAYNKAYYQANREKMIAKQAIHYQANREKILAEKVIYREVNREKILAQKATYYQANKEKVLARQAASYQANKEKVLVRVAKYREANPERREAHKAVASAIRSGKLVSLPCSECGETKADAHHYAYDMPLDVIWLCRKHHTQLHKEHREYEQLPQ